MEVERAQHKCSHSTSFSLTFLLKKTHSWDKTEDDLPLWYGVVRWVSGPSRSPLTGIRPRVLASRTGTFFIYHQFRK
jgi:hypothetical protein